MNIVFFGDSICNGQGIAIHKGWVTRISAGLSELVPGHNLVVVNASVNGRTTRQALESMPYEVQRSGAEVLIIQFGMNDCNIWETDRGNARVSPLAFEANLREIIQRAAAFGARSIFLNTNHPTGRDRDRLPHAAVTFEEQNRRYNQIIRSVAHSDPRVTFNDIEAAFGRRTRGERRALLRLLMPDLLHLSEEGHDLYHDTVYPGLAAQVRQLLRDRDAA